MVFRKLFDIQYRTKMPIYRERQLWIKFIVIKNIGKDDHLVR